MPHASPRHAEVPVIPRDTLAAALPREMARVAGLVPIYRSVPLGGLAAGQMELSLGRAHTAIAAGDLAAMIRAYQDLKGYSL